jgi:serine protease
MADPVKGWAFYTPTGTLPADDPTDPSHGTHVAGTIAASTNNGIGVAGVNWAGAAASRIMPIRALDGCGSGFYSDIALGIILALERGAKVINMSFGGEADSEIVGSAINIARAGGVTLVAAAGNDDCSRVRYPARNPNVIGVAATTDTNARAGYSNCGPEISVAAPGGSSTAGVLSKAWSPYRAGTPTRACRVRPWRLRTLPGWPRSCSREASQTLPRSSR